MISTNKKVHSLEKKSINFIANEMFNYLKTLRSDYFLFDPREPSENAILYYFNEIRSLIDKEKFRRAISKIIISEDFISHEDNIIFSLLNLIEDTRVRNVKEILIDLALKKEFFGKEYKTTSEIKNRIIFILAKKICPPISQKVLREIIENNIDNHICASTSLSAATNLIPRIDSFIEFFPRVLNTFKKNKENLIELAYVFFNFLIVIGNYNIIERFQDVFFINDREILVEIVEIIHFLGSEFMPINLEKGTKERIKEIQIKNMPPPLKPFISRTVKDFEIDADEPLGKLIIRNNPIYRGYKIEDDERNSISVYKE